MKKWVYVCVGCVRSSGMMVLAICKTIGAEAQKRSTAQLLFYTRAYAIISLWHFVLVIFFFLSSVFFGARFSSPLHSHTLPLCFFLFTLFYYYFIFFVSSCSSIIHSRFDHVREDDSVACHFSRVPSFGPPECIIISQSESFTLLFYL